MRIGIVGAAGTGKSTLTRELSHRLGMPLVPDFVPEVLKEHGKDSWKGVLDWKLRRAIRMEALRRKIAAEAQHERFVSDKTVVDYLAYWLQNQAEKEDRDQNLEFIDLVRTGADRYDCCVYLPYRPQVDFAHGRNQDSVHNLKVAANKRGLLTVFEVPTVDAPYEFGEDVKAWCERWLGRLP